MEPIFVHHVSILNSIFSVARSSTNLMTEFKIIVDIGGASKRWAMVKNNHCTISTLSNCTSQVKSH